MKGDMRRRKERKEGKERLIEGNRRVRMKRKNRFNMNKI